jgi:hypothetical protein
MPDRAHAASRRTMVPRPAGTGTHTGVSSHRWGSDQDVDDALHQHGEEEEDGKKQAWTSTTIADSDQTDADEWVTTSRHQRWQHPNPIPASVRSSSSNGSYVSLFREEEANEDHNESEYQHVLERQREIEGKDHASIHRRSSNESMSNERAVDVDVDVDAQQQVIEMHRGDNSSSSNHHLDNSDNDNSDEAWPCPRCTLYNPAATIKCVACNFKARQTTTATTATTIHPQDHGRLLQQQHQQRYRYRSTSNHRSRNRSHLLTALERELGQSNSELNTSTSTRSIASHAAATSTFAPSFQPQSQQQQSQSQQELYRTALAGHFTLSRAFVGSLLGAVLASVSSYVVLHQGEYYTHEYPRYPYSLSGISTFWSVVLEVALSGAIGGAVVRSVLEQQRAIQRARLLSNTTSSNSNNNDNDNSTSQHQDTDDPAVTFMMRSMTETAATSRLSSRQLTPAIGADGNSSSNGMLSYEYFLTSTGGNDRSEAIENARAAVEQDIFLLPSVQVLPDMDPNKLPEDCRRCAICLDAFLPGCFRKTLPCWHGFHTQCVDKWLRNVGACPICKHRIDG